MRTTSSEMFVNDIACHIKTSVQWQYHIILHSLTTYCITEIIIKNNNRVFISSCFMDIVPLLSHTADRDTGADVSHELR